MSSSEVLGEPLLSPNGVGRFQAATTTADSSSSSDSGPNPQWASPLSPVVIGSPTPWATASGGGIGAVGAVGGGTGGTTKKSRRVREKGSGGGGGSTLFASVVNICATAMGAGILSLPRAMAKCGVVLGVGLVFLFAGLADLSLVLLLDCSHASGRRSFETVAQHYVGRIGRMTVKMALVVFLFGAIVLMMIVVADLFTPVVLQAAGGISPAPARPASVNTPHQHYPGGLGGPEGSGGGQQHTGNYGAVGGDGGGMDGRQSLAWSSLSLSPAPSSSSSSASSASSFSPAPAPAANWHQPETHDQWYLSRVFVSGAGVIAVFPLTLVSKLSMLKYTSALALVFLAYLMIMIIVRFSQHVAGAGGAGGAATATHSPYPAINPSVQLARPSLEVGLAVPLFISSFACQFNIFKIEHELRPDLKPRIGTAVHIAIIGVAACTFSLGGALGYLLFGADVKNDLLEEWSGDNAMTAARVAVGLTNLLKIPLLVLPLRDAIDDLRHCPCFNRKKRKKKSDAGRSGGGGGGGGAEEGEALQPHGEAADSMPTSSNEDDDDHHHHHNNNNEPNDHGSACAGLVADAAGSAGTAGTAGAPTVAKGTTRTSPAFAAFIVFVETIVIVGVCFVCAFKLGSISKDLDLLGSTAGAAVCLILPATFFLVANRRYKRDLREAPAGSIVSVRAADFAGRYRRAKTTGAWLMLVIGIAIFVLTGGRGRKDIVPIYYPNSTGMPYNSNAPLFVSSP